MQSAKESYSAYVKQEALKLGFIFCGISKAGFLEEEAPRLEAWLKKNHHGSMSYMENHFDKRLDPTKLVEGSKSVISLGINYFNQDKQTDPSAPKISKYAYGQDYHEVIKKKLAQLIEQLRKKAGDFSGRAFVDSAPVLDKAWAKKAGLGWIGKNANLINRQKGSFFFLAELIVDLELKYDEVAASHDYCGSCTRCIDACPTEAILSPRIIDARKCISYLTIELKEELPATMKGKMDNWMFGCDVCQDVCPWNRFSTVQTHSEFRPHPDLLDFKKEDWEELTEEVFSKVFSKSAVKRTKFKGLKRNISFLRPPDTGL